MKIDKTYLARWINTIIPEKTRSTIPFEEWIIGFEDRYTEEQLKFMSEVWNRSYGQIEEIKAVEDD